MHADSTDRADAGTMAMRILVLREGYANGLLFGGCVELCLFVANPLQLFVAFGAEVMNGNGSLQCIVHGSADTWAAALLCMMISNRDMKAGGPALLSRCTCDGVCIGAQSPHVRNTAHLHASYGRVQSQAYDTTLV